MTSSENAFKFFVSRNFLFKVIPQYCIAHPYCARFRVISTRKLARARTDNERISLNNEIDVRFLLNEHGDLYFLLHNNSVHIILLHLKKN